MSQIVVTAILAVQPDKVEEVKRYLTETVLPPTHEEEGCIAYTLHQDVEDPTRLVFVEKWASKEALDAHMQSPHVQAMLAFAGDKLAAHPAIHVLAPVSSGGKGVL